MHLYLFVYLKWMAKWSGYLFSSTACLWWCFCVVAFSIEIPSLIDSRYIAAAAPDVMHV